MRTIAFLVGLAFVLSSCGDSSPRPVKRPEKKPATLIERLAGAEPTITGTAIMLVIDTSSSMNQKVRNASGGQEVKLAIAKRCAKTMVAQIHKFAVEHKDKKIVVGIVGFAGSPYKLIEPREIADGRDLFDKAIDKMRTGSGTAIGDAVIFAKKELDRTGFSRLSILTITDGENTTGEAPSTVAHALNKLPSPPGLYLIGFDVAAETFKAVKDAGSPVFSANNETELLETTEFVLGTKILAEKPE